MKKNSFNVVILGTDINAYYMSRNFHEAYNIKPHLIGKSPMNFTRLSNIVTIEYHEKLWETDTFRKVLKEYGENHKNERTILIGSNDHYVRLIVENKKLLEKYFIFNYPNLDIVDNLLVKDKFYEFVKDYDIDIPKTYIYQCGKKNDLKE